MKRLFIPLLILVIGVITIVGCAAPAPVKTAAPAATVLTTTAAPAVPKPATTSAPAATITAAKPVATQATTGQQYGGTLKFIGTVSPSVLGYPPDGDTNTGTASRPCVDSLLWNDEKGDPVPRLATAWDVTADGKTMLFILRKGVKFQDGSDFNAQAVAWNYNEQIAKNKASLDPVTNVVALDDYTVRMDLSKFSNAIYNVLAFASIVSPTAFNKNGKDWARLNPVGTGPFKFVDFKSNVSLRYVKFDNYWDKGKPYLDGFEFNYVADKTVAAMAFEKGDAHIMTQLTEKIASDLKAKGFPIRAMAGSSWFLVSDSKNADSPFAKAKVREAVEYAIDKVKIAQATGFGLVYASYQLAPPDIVGYNASLQPRVYDPAKARQLLKEAGYPTGFKTKFISQSSYNQDQIVAIQTFLKEVGIDATLDITDAARWTDYRLKGWVNGLAISRTGTDPNMNQQMVRDLATNTQWLPCLARPAAWQSTLDESVAARDIATRKVKQESLMKMAYDEAFVTPLWIGCDIAAMQKNVNSDILVTHHQQFKPADIWLSK